MRRNVFNTYDPNLPMGKKFVAVHVQNEDPLYFLVEVKSKVCELFGQITKFLNLLEPELFGLAIKSSETFIFLDPLEKLSRYAPKSWKTQNNGMDNDGLPLFNVFFRVQFYVDSYLFISDKVAKFYYYHQLRENVLHYDQSMCEERAFLLASYALQADYGNYNPKLHKNRYFDPNHYFPAWVIEELGVEYIQRHLPSLHCDHKGMSKSEAQSMFIREASDPSAAHNFHLYKMVSNKKASSGMSCDTWLAITITGLMIYAAEPFNNHSNTMRLSSPTSPKCRRLKTRISFFPWSDIGKLSFDKKKFEIRSTGPQSRKFIYYTQSEELARFLLWFSRASHQFHLMVLPKMREMLKREAEINRRKYREQCISTTSSRTSSSDNSSGAVMSSGSSNSASNNTSKSVSPFEMFSSTTSNTSDAKKGTSDLDISSSSVCCGMDMMDGDDNSKDGEDQQRVSVISNASSNTTSGIASDKMHGLGEDSDRDDLMMEADSLMSLNHRHHHNHGNIHALSGCSPQPVVSMESLALSEPIDHHRCHHPNHHHHHGHNHNGSSAKSMIANKKHSISISNIMITSSSSAGTESSNNSFSPTQQMVKATVKPATEIMVNSEKNSKVSLCLNINESQSTKTDSKNNNGDSSDDDDDVEDSSYEEIDSVFSNNSNDGSSSRYRGQNGSGKSNVTVLSTILKPEAERLLKQGIEADEMAASELLSMNDHDAIDSLELAELKEFEQAEKEKIILNSLIDNIPPPPTSIIDDSSDDDSSDESSDSSSSDSDSEDDDHHQPSSNSKTSTSSPKSVPKHYSPLAQEKRIHNKSKEPQHNNKSSPPSNWNISNSGITSRLRSKSSSSSIQTPNTNRKDSIKEQETKNHIYENIPVPNSKLSQIVQALVATPHKQQDGHHSGPFPPTVPLRPYPSLNSVPSPHHYPHRTGMRIGVSSLSRPCFLQQKGAVAAQQLLLQGGCIHSNPNKSNQNIPGMMNNGQCSLIGTSNLSAGSEPNLYFGGLSQQRLEQPPSFATESTPKSLTPNKIETKTQATPQASTFRQFIKNQLGTSSPSENSFAKLTLDLSMLQQEHQQPNNVQLMIVPNSDSVLITPPPSADYHKKSSTEQLSPSQKITYNSSPRCSNSSEQPQKKSKESRLRELRQRTSDLNLPLITALFNDSSLQLSDRFLDHPKSQSMQHLTAPSNHHHHHHHHLNGSCSSGGCSSASSSSSSTPSRASPATVERSCTFRVDEAIAKSALRQSKQREQPRMNDANNNNNRLIDHIQSYHNNNNNHNDHHRPTSWHLETTSHVYYNGRAPMVNKNSGWQGFYTPPNPNNQQAIATQRRLSTGNKPTTPTSKLFHRTTDPHHSPAMWIIDSPMTTG